MKYVAKRHSHLLATSAFLTSAIFQKVDLNTFKAFRINRQNGKISAWLDHVSLDEIGTGNMR